MALTFGTIAAGTNPAFLLGDNLLNNLNCCQNNNGNTMILGRNRFDGINANAAGQFNNANTMA